MTHKPSEDQIHQWRSDELVDLLLYAPTPKEVIDCLKTLDRLDGEPFRILIQQLDGTIPQKPKFRNRFQIVGSPGKPPVSIAHEPVGQRIIRQDYSRLREKGTSSKQALFLIAEKFDIKRSAILKILREEN